MIFFFFFTKNHNNMPVQDYKHHVRYYTTHHFIFYPVVLGAASVSAYFAASERNQHQLLWTAITGIFLVMAWLSYMLRQHYALNNQNRIVRLEMRFRYYVLTQQRLEPIENKLSFGQIASLRFASDEELPALVQRAVNENLSADEIKKSIHQWLPDHMRV
ncbi:MAG: hypothetical protein K0R51_14 [Cytophagaceae bacterium]|nr:hypothetical protein [Cytophagaceae bacterium]